VPPEFPAAISASASTRHNLPASFPTRLITVWRRLRFGEAVFRETLQKEQEEKTPFVAFSSQNLIFV
jgi:hypothetical protein